MLPAGMSRTGVKNSYWTFVLVAAKVLDSMRNNTGLAAFNLCNRTQCAKLGAYTAIAWARQSWRMKLAMTVTAVQKTRKIALDGLRIVMEGVFTAQQIDNS